jgi:hypothetical protein
MEGAVIIILLVIIPFVYYRYWNKKNKDRYTSITWKDLLLIKQWLALCSPRDFEVFCTMLYTLKGERAIATYGTNDFGRDIIIYSINGTETLIECKLCNIMKTSDVDQSIAQKLAGSMWHESKRIGNKVFGKIITTGNATEEAREFCDFMGIEIIEIDGIMKLIESVGSSKVLLACGIVPSCLEDKHYPGSLRVGIEEK